MNKRIEWRSSRWMTVRREIQGRLIVCLGLALVFWGPVRASVPEFSKSEGGSSQATVAPKGEQEIRPLEMGKPIERELGGGQAHSYRITLSSGQYLRVVVDQRGIDVVVRLFGPDGLQLAQVDSPNGKLGPEPLSVLTQASGGYKLEVRALEEKATSGRFEVRIEELREATPQDRNRIAAEKAFGEAEQLRAQGTVESRRGAIKKYEEALSLWRVLRDSRAEAKTLNNIGEAYYFLGESQKALDYFGQALQLQQGMGDRQGEATTLTNIAGVYSSLGEKQKALLYYSQALSTFSAVGNVKGEADALTSIAGVYTALQENKKAIDYYNHALSRFREIGDRQWEANMLLALGVSYAALGESQKALDYFNQALPIFRVIGDNKQEVLLLTTIGLVHRRMGENRKALDYLSQAFTLHRALRNHWGEAASLIGLGETYANLGESQKALDYFNQALPLFRSLGDRRSEASAISNLGTVYGSLGEQRRALDYYRQALALHQMAGDRKGEATSLANIAGVYSSLGENQRALDYYSKGVELQRAIGDRWTEAGTLANIGFIYATLGEKKKALDHMSQALALHRAVGNHQGEAHTLIKIGAVYRSLGENQKALECLRQVLPLTQGVGNRDDEALALFGLACVEYEQGELIDAREKMEMVLAISESSRTKTTNPEWRASYFASVQGEYELYINLLMRLQKSNSLEGYDVTAFATTERARARSLLEMLTEARADIRQGVDPTLLERQRALQQQLNAKEQDRMKLLSSKYTEEQRAASEKEMRELLTQYQEVQAQIRTTSPRYAALTQPQPLGLKEIQQQVLDADTLLLEYALGEEQSYLFSLTPTSFSSHELPKRAEIENAARRVSELLTARGQPVKFETPEEKSARVEKADAEYPAAAATLSQMILGPVANQLGKKRLLIVADGALQYVPFGALPVPQRVKSDGGKRDNPGRDAAPASRFTPLLAEHEIVNIPSASTLAVLRRELAGRKTAPKALAVLADPVFESGDERVKVLAQNRRREQTAGSAKGQGEAASASVEQKQVQTAASVEPSLSEYQLQRSARESGVLKFDRLRFTRQEAEGITALVSPKESKKALDFSASRTTATSPELSQYRIVHFATHGLLNSQHPELTGLVLSLVDENGKPQDGFLRLHDLYNLNLPAEVVVLSACKTGLGKEIKGEGLIGLTRGFMYAGAKCVVVSLWDVNDAATAELMVRFYWGILKAKMRPAAALRAAQVSMWKEKRWSSPYYWATFQPQGEWR